MRGIFGDKLSTSASTSVAMQCSHSIDKRVTTHCTHNNNQTEKRVLLYHCNLNLVKKQQEKKKRKKGKEAHETKTAQEQATK